MLQRLEALPEAGQPADRPSSGAEAAARAAEAEWDRDLPARWPSLVATAEAAGEALAPRLLRLLELRRRQWCRRWRRDWPL